MLVYLLCQSIFFMNLYQVLILSYLLIPTDNNPFETVEQMAALIATGHYHLVTNDNQSWYECSHHFHHIYCLFFRYFDTIRESPTAAYVQLRSALASNPIVSTTTIDEALDYVDRGNYIFPSQVDSYSLYLSKKRCNFAYINDGERHTRLIRAHLALLSIKILSFIRILLR